MYGTLPSSYQDHQTKPSDESPQPSRLSVKNSEESLKARAWKNAITISIALLVSLLIMVSGAPSVVPRLHFDRDETFRDDTFDAKVAPIQGAAATSPMGWYNEPTMWSDNDGQISVRVPGPTDYWRITLHGFIKDDGPFYYKEAEGDFEASVKVSGNYASLYHQAGLMVRLDEYTWMKCGIEFYRGIRHASTVITRDFADWSIQPVGGDPETVWFKVVRTKEYIEV